MSTTVARGSSVPPGRAPTGAGAERLRQPAIGSYAAIGDGRSVALIGADGAIDWLAWPRFDSSPAFAAVLDPDVGGRFELRPVGPSSATRRYLPATNVLATCFVTEGGTATVLDFMPLSHGHAIRPDHELVRCVRCDRGVVEMEARLVIGTALTHRRGPLRVHDRGPLGVRIEAPGGAYVARAEWPLHAAPSGAHGRVTLREGERATMALAYHERAPGALPVLGETAWRACDETADFWRGWSERARLPGDPGPRRDLVLRSALALQLLVYAASGAIVAAPTTSLPERIGGDLNWDYRFCWLRDASMTVRALLGLGFDEEATAFVDWLLHATRLTFPGLRILYDVHGNAPVQEQELPDLAGHRGSRPVRIGNAARDQVQLDVHGEVIDAVARLARHRGSLDREAARFLVGLGRHVCARWREPDHGIWEPRIAPVEHTHSRLLCWVALDRLLDLDARRLLHLPDRPTFERERRELREAIETASFSTARGSYVATVGGDDLDASALLIPFYGFEEADAPRMRATYRAVHRELGAGNALLRRHLRASGEEEGAFGICGFWGVEVLARGGGTLAEAEVAFDTLCGFANDVGLFGEEIDPDTGAALGNFPQAFTHVGLISAALALEERRTREGRSAGQAGAPEGDR